MLYMCPNIFGHPHLEILTLPQFHLEMETNKSLSVEHKGDINSVHF